MVVKKEVVEYYLKLLQRINIKVRGIEVTSTALYNAIAKNGQGTSADGFRLSDQFART